jgi:hypothetical protein
MISLPDHHLKKVSIDIEYPRGENCKLPVNAMHDGKYQHNLIYPDSKPGCAGQVSYSNRPAFKSTGAMVDLTYASIEELSYSINEKENNDYGFYQ